MRRTAGLVLVFVVGLAAGLLALRIWNTIPFSRTPGGVARQRALDILSRPATGAPVPDNAVVLAARKIAPAVVNIEMVGARRGGILGTPFERLYMMQGRGSGVIISPDGYIATNNHVIVGAEVIRVTLTDGRRFEGRIIGEDAENDLAVIKVDGANLPTATLADSDQLKVGEYVVAVGYPLGLGTTVTHGIISATDRENLPVSAERVLRRALQTDAPINRGNSGGALANLNGDLVGINTAIASEGGGGSIGIGFAIPVNTARGILQGLIRTGRSQPAPTDPRPYMGVVFGPVDPELAMQYGMPDGQGVVVMAVQPLSPAESVGLARGNVITSIDGQPVRGPDDVSAILSKRRAGDEVKVTLVRGNGTTDTVTLTLGHRPPSLQQR